MKIIIADDNPDDRSALAAGLRGKGYDILEATDGQEVLALMSQKPTAIITEAHLRDMGGFALCRLIRKAARSSYAYIILLSKSLSKPDTIKGLLVGADAFIAKPADVDEVDAQIKAGMRLIGFFGRQPPEKASNEKTFPKEKETPPKPIPPKDAASSHPHPSTDPSGAAAADAQPPPLPPPPVLDAAGAPAVDPPPPHPSPTAPAGAKNLFKIEDTTKNDRVLAKIALDNHLVTKKHLAEAFTIQKREQMAGRKMPLDLILLERGMVTEDKINDLRVATNRRMGKRFGVIAIQKGLTTQEQIDQALDEQAEEYKRLKTCRRLGEILVAQSVITETQRDEICREQEKAEALTPQTADPQKDQSPSEGRGNAQQGPFSLTISPDKMTATLQKNPQNTGKGTLEEIKSLLAEYGVKHGIIPDDQIGAFLNSSDNAHEKLIVAQGVPPRKGADASIQYHFNTDYLTAGKVADDGDIDFRDRGDRPRVSKGTVIAEKIPMKKSEDGIDVLGNAVSLMEKPEDVQMICEDGVEISDDGLKAIAKIDGEPNVTKGGKISVFDELEIKGDVDFSTGNIRFNGNIRIKGAIREGFQVAGGNIIANEISGAFIEAAGDVNVAGGILGAKILSEGNITAKYIDTANIKCFGSVMVKKEVRNSKIRVSGEFKSEAGAIISSFVAAKLGIKVKNIGTDVSEPCKIQIGVDENVRKRIQAYGFRHAEKQKILEQLQIDYEGKNQELTVLQEHLTELAQVQDRGIINQRAHMEKIAVMKQQGKDEELKIALVELNKCDSMVKDTEAKVSECFRKQEQLQAEASKALAEIENIIAGIESIGNEKTAVIKWSEKNKSQGVLQVTGTIRAGTKIHGSQAAMVLQEDMRNITAREVKTNREGETYEIAITRG